MVSLKANKTIESISNLKATYGIKKEEIKKQIRMIIILMEKHDTCQKIDSLDESYLSDLEEIHAKLNVILGILGK